MDLLFFLSLPFRFCFWSVVFDLLQVAKAVEKGFLEVIRRLLVLLVPLVRDLALQALGIPFLILGELVSR